MIEGWAVIDGSGNVLVRTVSDTRRAAIVNWLVTVLRIMIMNSESDEDIERAFTNNKNTYRVDVARVRVEVL